MPSYIPSKDADFLVWAQHFSTYLTAHAEELGILPAEALQVANSVTNYNTRMAELEESHNAARGATFEKDRGRDASEDIIRSVVRRIQASPTVSDTMRAGLGVPLQSQSGPNMAAPPTVPSRPVGSIDTSERFMHTIRYWDEELAPRRARPSWALGAEIFCAITAAGTAAPDSIELYTNLGLNSASPFEQSFEISQGGKMAHYLMRWASRDGEKGPWSEVISATIVG